MKNCSENWKFAVHKILYSMVTCFWWFPSSKPSWFAGNWRLCPNELNDLLRRIRCLGIFAWVRMLRWGNSSLPRNFLTSQDISCSEVTMFGDVSFLVCFSSKTLLEVRFFQMSSRSFIFSHGNAFTRNHHFPSKSKSMSGPVPLKEESPACPSAFLGVDDLKNGGNRFFHKISKPDNLLGLI